MTEAVEIHLRRAAIDDGAGASLDHLDAQFVYDSYTQVPGPLGPLAGLLLDLIQGRRAPTLGVVRYGPPPDSLPGDVQHAASRGTRGLVGGLTVEQNLLLGRRTSRLRRREGRRLAAETLADLGLNVDLDQPCNELSPAEGWGVALARAVILPASSYFFINQLPTGAAPLLKGALARIRDRQRMRSPVIVAQESSAMVDVALATHLLCLRDGFQTYFGPLTAEMQAEWPVYATASGDAVARALRNALHRLALLATNSKEFFSTVLQRARDWLGVQQLHGVLLVPGREPHWAGGDADEHSDYAQEVHALLQRVLTHGEAVPDQVPLALNRATLVRLAERDKLLGLMVMTEPMPASAQTAMAFAREFASTLQDMLNREALAQAHEQGLRNRSVGSMAFTLAHEMNNLLQIVSVTAGMQLHAGEAADSARHARTILQATRQGTTLLQPLLDYGRSVEATAGRGDVHSATRTALELLRSATPPQVTVEAVLDAPRAVVGCDEGSLKTVVFNLALNSVQAMSENGGTLRIQTREIPAPAGLGDLRGVTMQGPCLELQVVDDGPGIPAHALHSIFEPHYTTRASGSGLGLSTVRSIVREAGAFIDVQSKPGQGAQFRVLFRLSEPRREAINPRADVAGARVIVCDDNDLLREVITRWLQEAGCEVTPFADGASCINFLRRHPDANDVMLLDYRMSPVSGQDVFHAGREYAPKLLQIMLSGYSSEIDLNMLRSQGLAAFLPKPVDNDVILATIQAVLEQMPHRHEVTP